MMIMYACCVRNKEILLCHETTMQPQHVLPLDPVSQCPHPNDRGHGGDRHRLRRHIRL
jgi:hypothetical protein